MRRLLPVLLSISACSPERTPPVSPAGFTLTRHSLAGSLIAPTTGGEAPSYSTAWADSSRLGDTVFYTRGTVITTIAVHTDSQWVVRPPAAVARVGIPYGPSQLPPDSLCTLGYTGTTLPVVPRKVLRDLDRTHECKAGTFAQIRRAKLKDSDGNLSVQAALAEISEWPWPELCARVKDSTIIGFHIGDDVVAKEWGPAPLEERLARWDSIAGGVAAKCPGAAIVIRARARQLARRDHWDYLTTAWAQYPGPLPRAGTPEEFFAAEVESAKKQHLGLVTGVNLLGGGCGPAETGRCLPDIPGSSLRGSGKNTYQLSAQEFIDYKTAAMSDPYVCASVDWGWSPSFKSNFHTRPEIQTAAKALGLIASKRARASCVQR
jgi:hypothetical protein